MDDLINITLMVMYLVGLVVAEGATSTIIAFFIMPYGWYLCIEFILKATGIYP